jgi:hypothetical protein
VGIDFGRLGPDQGGQKFPTKQNKKGEKISRFEVLDVLF